MMNRRRFLAGAGVALPMFLSGCLGTGDEPADGGGSNDLDDGQNDTNDPNSTDTGDKDSVPVLRGHAVSAEAVTPDVERRSDMDAWGVFVATRDAAEEYFGATTDIESDTVRTFIEETAFASGDRLLYVQAFAPQICYELVVDEEPFVAANGIARVNTRVNRTAPDDQPCGDAVTTVDVLLRLSFDLDAGSPDVVEVEVSGHRDESEELLVESER